MLAWLVAFQCTLISNAGALSDFYHDSLNEITYPPWRYSGNASAVSSSNCPSFAEDASKAFSHHKICITNSYNLFWDGQYEWKSSNNDRSIYQHIQNNKLIYQFTNNSYYFNDFETNRIMTTRCIAQNIYIYGISDCNGNWENYYNDRWNIDSNMITSWCNDICIYNNDELAINYPINPHSFVWFAYNQTRRTNIYRCNGCSIDLYLYGYINTEIVDNGLLYSWLIGPDPNQGDTAWNLCILGYNLSNNYTFQPLDCSSAGCWQSFTNNTWITDDDVVLSACLSKINYEYNTLTVSQENQLCIKDANDTTWDGIYKWFYYDSFVNASSYYNVHKNIYVYPEITAFDEHRYTIYLGQTMTARCNGTDILNIAYCIGKWRILQNDEWNIDSNMITTPCQDVVVYTNSHPWIFDYGLFEWSAYNTEHKSNIYHCIQCKADTVYLYGWKNSPEQSGNIGHWIINHEGTKGDIYYYVCSVGKVNADYVFNLDNCSAAGSWLYSPDIYLEKLTGKCVKLESNATIDYSRDKQGSYQNHLALGFDLNIARLDVNDSFTMQYVWHCVGIDRIDHIYTGLSVITDEIIAWNIVYHLLEPSCNDTPALDIKFRINSTDETHKNIVFIDNIYLFDNSDDSLFFDNMDNGDWTTVSKTAIGGYNSSEYCKSDNKCYTMFTSENESVSIAKTVELDNQYKDIHIEWSLISNGLSGNATFNVFVYCDDKMHILKQYNSSKDCVDTNNSCYMQSYNLPSETCDFASQIVIGFNFLSASASDIVYIDYVQLTHSVPSSYTYNSIIPETYDYYPYLYHDPLYTLSNWKYTGNVSIDSSSNCPSEINQNASVDVYKLCISNSNNSLWDGLYEWRYYDKNINGSVYHNKDNRANIYQYMKGNTNRFYINSYEKDTRISMRCIGENIIDIRQCIGKWQANHDGRWINDTNIISTTCNDICVNAADNLNVADGAVFKWAGFFYAMRTNFYYSEEEDAYLTGYIFPLGGQNIYVWGLAENVFFIEGSGEAAQFNVLYWCQISSNYAIEYSEDYVFDVRDCLGSEDEQLWLLAEIFVSVDLSLSLCSLNNDAEISSLPSMSESQICIENSHNAMLDGIYKWSSYDTTTNASIYYNAERDAYMEPYVNSTDNYQYRIYQHMEGEVMLSRCVDINILSDMQCVQKWEIYYDGVWNADSNMVVTPCQSVCFEGDIVINSDLNAYIDGKIFVYSHFDNTQKSNVYYSKEIAMYLYGWSVPNNNNVTGWLIGDTFSLDITNPEQLSAACILSAPIGNKTAMNIDDCACVGSWSAWDGSAWQIKQTTSYKCNFETVTTCAKLQGNSEIYRSVPIDTGYYDLAVGLDLNMKFFSESDVLIILYCCGESNEMYRELTAFAYDSTHSYVTNAVYSLPTDSCDNTAMVSLKLMMNGDETVYIDNIYVYYGVSNEIFTDQFVSSNDGWNERGETAMVEYDDCECYILYVSQGHDHVAITKITEVSVSGYKYSDYALEWSLQIDGLSDGAILDVKFQCDDNYLYVYDLCVLKEYSIDSICADNSCNVQLYQLPKECDLSSAITVQFYLKSSSVTDRVYIDYVSLKHSETSGNIAPLCRTSSPTELPTFSPTPLSIPTVITPFQWKWEYILAIVLGALLVLAIAIIATYLCVKRYAVNQYKMEMTVRNAMVILISIGEYDENAVNPDPELENVYMHDLAVERDITNLHLLFGPENLNYEIYPTYNLKYPRVHWTQKQIIDLLQQKAKQFYQERDKFDALVVAVSCHGMNKNIITSDFKLIEKVAIHRLFSTQYPESRELPRVFLFDCCDGNNERTIADSDSDDNEADNKTEAGKQMKERKMTPKVQTIADEMKDEEKTTEQGKNFGVDNIEGHSDNWNVGDRNPDHRLVEINAANPGFQSKLDSNIGSYMLYEFVKKTLDDLGDDMEKGEKCLYEIFAEIQQELADRGKQQIITTYNNRTRYIKFQKNIAVDSTSDDQQNETNTPIIEMQHVKTGDNGSENVGLETKVDEQEHLISS